MKKLVLILAVLNLVGCSESPKQVAARAQRASESPVISFEASSDNGATWQDVTPTHVVEVRKLVHGQAVFVPIYADDKLRVPLTNPMFGRTDGKIELYVDKPGAYKLTIRTMKDYFGIGAKAGAHSEPTGKPDSEKPEKK